MNKKLLIFLLSLTLLPLNPKEPSFIPTFSSTVNLFDNNTKDWEHFTIEDALEGTNKCNEEDKRCKRNKNFFVNFHNGSYSTKESSWFFKPNSKGATPEEPSEVLELIKNNSAYFVGNTEQKELYITFDEGYENGKTEKILDILKKHNVKAAFFVVEPYIKQNEQLVKRMSDEGHLVCNHSAHHPSMAKITDFEKFKKELKEVEEAYKAVTGKDMPKYFRPPMGRYSALSLHYTKELGYKSVFWSSAHYDWDVKKQPNPEDAKKLLLKRTHNGAIILLHAVSKTNSDILDELITSWKSQGYSFKTLDQLPND